MKISYEEIKLLLLQMDEEEEIPRDMLEQVSPKSGMSHEKTQHAIMTNTALQLITKWCEP